MSLYAECGMEGMCTDLYINVYLVRDDPGFLAGMKFV